MTKVEKTELFEFLKEHNAELKKKIDALIAKGAENDCPNCGRCKECGRSDKPIPNPYPLHYYPYPWNTPYIGPTWYTTATPVPIDTGTVSIYSGTDLPNTSGSTIHILDQPTGQLSWNS